LIILPVAVVYQERFERSGIVASFLPSFRLTVVMMVMTVAVQGTIDDKASSPGIGIGILILFGRGAR